jgi:uncharacterized membrane protein YeaQ/YmgE (transglycosylase-associated protein family)
MLLILVYTILIGAISGYLTCRIMKINLTTSLSIILGVIGGLVGSLILKILGIAVINTIGYIIASVIGACILCFLYEKYYIKK